MKTLEIEKKLKNAIKISIMNRYSEVEPILFDILKDLNQLYSHILPRTRKKRVAPLHCQRPITQFHKQMWWMV